MHIKLAQRVPPAALSHAVLRDAAGAEIGRLRECALTDDGTALTAPDGAKAPDGAAQCDLVYKTTGALYGVPVAKE